MESEKVIMASDARDALGDDVPKLQVHDEKVERNVHVDEAIARGIAGDVDDFHVTQLSPELLTTSLTGE